MNQHRSKVWYPSLPRRTRISCCAALYMATRAAFNKESRMSLCESAKTNRKSGAWGTRSFVAEPDLDKSGRDSHLYQVRGISELYSR
jgi:hypothetical protein